jgi:hypothetical protein
MMRKIWGNSISHNLIESKFPKSSYFICTACVSEKLILRHSPPKIQVESLKFIKRIQGDICGPIQPLSGPFMDFMVFINACTRWSHVCRLSKRDHVFAKFMMQAIRLKEKKFEHRIQSVWLDSVVEFSSRTFNDYCMPKELKCHIRCHMCIPRMVWMSLLSRELNWLLDHYCVIEICQLLVGVLLFYMLLT